MAGFFSLGGTTTPQGNTPTEIRPGNRFWHINEDVPYKGFELWQKQQQQQQLQQQQDLYVSAAGLGVGPSINFADDSSSRSGFMMMRSGGGGGGGGKLPGLVLGFLLLSAVKGNNNLLLGSNSNNFSFEQRIPKDIERIDPRLPTLTLVYPLTRWVQFYKHCFLVILTRVRTREFPAEVNSEAVFRCVRVSSIEDADDQYAYQTSVNIVGHVFKGILYNQGPECGYDMVTPSAAAAAEISSGAGLVQPLNLITAGSTAAATTNTATIVASAGGSGASPSSATALLDPCSLCNSTQLFHGCVRHWYFRKHGEFYITFNLNISDCIKQKGTGVEVQGWKSTRQSHLYLSLSTAKKSVPISEDFVPSPAKSLTTIHGFSYETDDKFTGHFNNRLTISLRFHFALRFCRCDFIRVAILSLRFSNHDIKSTDSIQRGEEEIWFHFSPAYTCFGRKEFCLITGLRFGHDDVGRYTRHIAAIMVIPGFPDESMEKPNLHVDD
ncbi:Detected protein of unknown function [Hibiscus syriacus]|uniref:Uncharacterized protein n=1 Tax=Hibiscus syriacus TaxID=106335 RepID=A0A6A2WJ05_HIBSY|nr:Detected protein of unknown function [Hibiscus syriacus]